MAPRLQSFRALLPELKTALQDFRSSNATFRLLKQIHPSTPNLLPQNPSSPSTENPSPKTLFIMDSSFNPPSIAHKYLLMSALRRASTSAEEGSGEEFPKPWRLMLLFATMNADKAPSAAEFEQRILLMTLFAHDLLADMLAHKTPTSTTTKFSPDSADTETPSLDQIPSIDIALTKEPYYTAKTSSITSEATNFYPDSPRHVHLIGYDTLTRLFNPKYYPSHNPPLSALAPYFEQGHSFNATIRPDNEYGSESEQRAFVQNLADGGLEAQGAERSWAKQVRLMDPRPAGEGEGEGGVSSTRIRRAAKRGDWEEVRGLCTGSVAEWVREEELYAGDDRGAKMA